MALNWKLNITRFDRWGNNLGNVIPLQAEHSEDLDGTDTLTLLCREDVAKGDRFVWKDPNGVLHEHMADETERTHDATGEPLTLATCINSVAELWGDYIDDLRPSGDCAKVLSLVLSGTRWDAGSCVPNSMSQKVFYHQSVREAVVGIQERFNCEMYTTVHAFGGEVGQRYIHLKQRGDSSSFKRFTWTKDLVSVKRKVYSDNPVTRLYGYGKGEETDSGGYGRRIDFASINDGKKYVEDEEATAIWGHYDDKGNVVPETGVYIAEDIEVERELLGATKAELERRKKPIVEYETDVVDLSTFGRDWEKIAIGDRVLVVDREFGAAPLRLQTRVRSITRDLLTNNVTCAFGNRKDSLTAAFVDLQQVASEEREVNTNHIPYAVLTDDGALLIMYPYYVPRVGDPASIYRSDEGGMIEYIYENWTDYDNWEDHDYWYEPPWGSHKDEIYRLRFLDEYTLRLYYTDRLFWNMQNCVICDIAKLKIRPDTNMHMLFYNLPKVELLDLRAWEGKFWFAYTFGYMRSLRTIYATDKLIAEPSPDSTYERAFTECPLLTGRASASITYRWDEDHNSAEYARLATSTQRGYFTESEDWR